ncbi:MAG: hypothetical protein ACXVJ7_01280 [Acidimicrobiia bacterium]
MAAEARLALTKVRVGGRAAGVYVYDDRIVITTDDGDRTIPMADLERVGSRRNWRGARLLLAFSNGEVVQVRRLSQSATRVAHRTVVDIARRFH